MQPPSWAIWIFIRPTPAFNRRTLPSDALLGTDLWPGKCYWQPVSYSHTHSYTLKQKQGPSALSPHGPKPHTWIETGQSPPSSAGTHPHTHWHPVWTYTSMCTQIKNGAHSQQSKTNIYAQMHESTCKENPNRHVSSFHWRWSAQSHEWSCHNASFEANMNPRRWRQRGWVGGFPPPPLKIW